MDLRTLAGVLTAARSSAVGLLKPELYDRTFHCCLLCAPAVPGVPDRARCVLDCYDNACPRDAVSILGRKCKHNLVRFCMPLVPRPPLPSSPFPSLPEPQMGVRIAGRSTPQSVMRGRNPKCDERCIKTTYQQSCRSFGPQISCTATATEG